MKESLYFSAFYPLVSSSGRGSIMMSETNIRYINQKSRMLHFIWYFFLGKDGGEWYVNLKSGSGSAGRGRTPDPQCTVTMESTDFVRMFAGELKPMQAYMSGQLKIRGNMALAMKLETLMDKMKSRLWHIKYHYEYFFQINSLL